MQGKLRTSLRMVAYSTTKMDDDTAFALTKTYWETREAMAKDAALWAGVSTDM